MDFIDEVRTRSGRFEQRLEHLDTEEATKTGLVMPFVQMLGYNVFDPAEVVPEFTADFGAKRGEKVDYAIVQHGQPIILIEAKKYGTLLRVEQESQLFRYFTATATRFGILTDGVIYRFFADLDKPNTMDSKPFFEFNMLSFTDGQVEQLKEFHKDNFSVTETIEVAREFKYTNEIKQALSEEMKEPSEPFVRFMLQRIEYPGSKSKQRIEQFVPLVRSAFSNLLKGMMDTGFKIARERSNEQLGPVAAEPGKHEPPAETNVPPELPVIVYSKTRAGVNATGRQEKDRFVLLADSRVMKQTHDSLSPTLLAVREAKLRDGLLVPDGPDHYRLVRDLDFNTSSAAASFCNGWSQTGPRTWKNAEGQTLKDLMGADG